MFPDLSRSFIQKAIDCGNVSVNGKTVAKNYKLKTDERIEYIPLEPVKLEVKAQNIPLDIVYEDDDLLVVNKPKVWLYIRHRGIMRIHLSMLCFFIAKTAFRELTAF